MAAGIVVQGAVVGSDIFQCHPYAAHESLGNGIEMDHVRVGLLLRTFREVEGLEGDGLPSVQKPELFKDDIGGGHLLYIFIEGPCVLDPLTSSFLQLAKGLFHAFVQSIDKCVVESGVEDNIAVVCKAFYKCFVFLVKSGLL